MFKVEITHIQGINSCTFELTQDSPNLQCIVGKNASGKTTFIRAIANIAISDVFKTQCTRHIFDELKSKITYKISGNDYSYTYNKRLQVLDCKGLIPEEDDVKKFCIECSFPYGNRYSHIQKIRSKDQDIRAQISLNNYETPHELIKFMNQIYNTLKFDNIKEINFNKFSVCVFLQSNGKYIREDHLSSGEFFLINLYRTFKDPEKKFIIIDEIDSALDAEAQVNLVRYLRELSNQENKKIVFTSHSLALIKTLAPNELLYLSNENGTATLTPQSYHYIKSLLFGFKGFDKYILVEDEMTRCFLQFLIQKRIKTSFFKYKILPVGTANSIIALYEKNKHEQFLSEIENILIILDGDQHTSQAPKERLFLPFKDIEIYLYELFLDDNQSLYPLVQDEIAFIAKSQNLSKASKAFYQYLLKRFHLQENSIFNFIIDRETDALSLLTEQLTSFLAPLNSD